MWRTPSYFTNINKTPIPTLIHFLTSYSLFIQPLRREAHGYKIRVLNNQIKEEIRKSRFSYETKRMQDEVTLSQQALLLSTHS